MNTILRLAPVLLSLSASAVGQNLIVNGGGETGDLTGWSDPLGNGFGIYMGPAAPAVEGSWILHGGTVGPAGPWDTEVRQDVDVSTHAGWIDTGQLVSFFSGQGRTHENGGFVDSARVILEFRSASDTILDTFDTGTVAPYNVWNPIADERVVPATTRTLRVRLLAHRDIGVSSDSFFDDLDLSVAKTNGPSYCTATVNSAGCAPSISASGCPGFSAPGPFDLLAAQELNFKNGLLFYGFAPAAIPFLGGTLCVQPPLRRTAIQNSGGNLPPTNDCSGSYAFDFNAWIQGGGDPNVLPGAPVYAQYWSRDPGSPQLTGLTNALSFTPAP